MRRKVRLLHPEFPAIRFHDLRHTNATQLFQGRIPVKAVAERLGHSTATLTLNTYAHVLPGMRSDAARVMEALLSDEQEEKKGATREC
jgi:integrase